MIKTPLDITLYRYYCSIHRTFMRYYKRAWRRFAGTNAVNIQFIGLGRIAGPFAALIAGTVFLSRGGRIYTKLAELASTEIISWRGSEPFTGSGYISAPEHQSGG